MKKIISGLIIFFALLLVVTTSYAEENFGQRVKNTISNTVEEGENEDLSPKEIRKEVRENVREQVKENVLEKVKNFLKKNLRFDARKTCTITTKGTNTLAVDCDGDPYTVNVDENTKYVRKFGGKSSFDELAVDDKINVFGKFTDESKTTIDAKLIRDLSIQKRWGVFFGEVTTAPDSTKFVIKTIQRGDMTVYFDEETKFLDHKKESIDSSDISVGMRVRVKGVWDKTSFEVRETEEVRVFPQKPSITPEPSP